MPRQLNTAAQIRQRVQDISNESAMGILIPLPLRLDRVDSTGCNWWMEYYDCAGLRHARQVETIVESVRAGWNLQ